MKKRKKVLKPFVLPVAIVLCSIVVALGSVTLNNSLKVAQEISDKNYLFVTSEILPNNSIPVILETEETVIKKPYDGQGVTIAKSFYDYKKSEEDQQSSIIYYQDTYIQNTGVDYASETEFAILAILGGKVMSITEDDIVGKTIKIKHSNDMISVYQSLKETNVKIDDEVMQGQKIGISGNNEIHSEISNHLHFELYVSNKLVNPEEFYGKKLGEI